MLNSRDNTGMTGEAPVDFLHRATPRLITARRVAAFDPAETAALLRSRSYTTSDNAFMLVELLRQPAAEIVFDACTDGEILYLTVLFRESNFFYRLGADSPLPAGAGNNCVEVIFAPYGDGNGHLQFGAGPGESRWFTHHWPYRDGRESLVARPQWEVDWQCEKMGEELAWTGVFRFPIAGIVGEGYDGPIGFNLMRTQLATGENATWSHAGGSGFPDASSMGWLRLAEDVPAPDLAGWFTTTEMAPDFQLHGTYDWPDEMCGGPYTPEVLRGEFRLLRAHGMRRICWIDYPFFIRALDCTRDGIGFFGKSRGSQLDNLAQTVKAFGGDPLPTACRLAHEEGLDFFTVIKPYDLWCLLRAPVTEEEHRGFPRTLGGYAVTVDPFVAAHPEYAFRRNPAWTQPAGPQQLRQITFYADNDAPLPFDPVGVTVFTSDDNVTYVPLPHVRITEEVVERPRYRWTPAGKVPLAGTERVRALTLGGLDVTTAYFAVAFPRFTGNATFGNQRFLLVEAHTADGLASLTQTTQPRGDFRTEGFEFHRGSASAGWSNASEAMELREAVAAGSALGFALGQDSYLVGMLEPGFADVRCYWLEHYVQRAIDAGADGVDVRIAHHHVCAEWLSFLYAEPNLAAFRAQFDREPQATAEDYAAMRRIRGEFHTQFLREAGILLHNAGRKLEAHVESRMTPPPVHDTFTQIHWDYATWIDEGIVDGVNLKYLGPFVPFVQREILPRTRRQGIPVHMIAAVGDPRTNPSAPEYLTHLLQMARAGGLSGLNLYEIWCYLRTTPRGEPFARGCALHIFAQLANALKEVGHEVRR